MFDSINKNEGIIALVGVVLTFLTFLFSKLIATIIFIIFIIFISVLLISRYCKKNKQKPFSDVQKIAKILFIDDRDCQIVTSLKRNNFDVKKIDDVQYPATDVDVQWANIIFVDYKDVGKKLFGQKEGLGLIGELKRVYGDRKRYVIYSSVQNFDGMFDFPYIRKNASYDEFISLVESEISHL